MDIEQLLSVRARLRLLAGLGASVATRLLWPQPAIAAPDHPSFVVVVLDDMRGAGWVALPKTRVLMDEQGTRFDNFIVTTPFCSPSRTTILTGQYVHNPDVTDNVKQFTRNGLASQTIAWALQQNGYRTAMIGKFLHGQPEKGQKPAGWDRFEATIDSSYYQVVFNENGRRRRYGTNRYEADILREGAELPERSWSGRPLFSLLRSEGAARPGGVAQANEGLVRRRDHRADSRFQRVGCYRKTGACSEIPPAQQQAARRVEPPPAHAFRRRRCDRRDLGNARGERPKTSIFVMSDNGYMLGHHGLTGKTTPYLQAVRIPLYARGPGFARGAVEDRLVENLDIAPTVAAATGVPLPSADGVSLLAPTVHDALR